MNEGDSGATEDWQLQVWGTPWTPDEFVDRAVVAGHPAKLHSFLPLLLRDCIEKSLTKSCSQRMAHRAQALKHWLRRSIQLKHQEEELVRTLEPGVAEVLQGKRILVWKEMLQSINYSDMGVVDEFCAGSRLTGQTDLTNLWQSKVTPATMTEGELHAQARLQRDGICERKRQVFCGTEAGGWSAILAQADQPPCHHVVFCDTFLWVRGQLQCIPSSPML